MPMKAAWVSHWVGEICIDDNITSLNASPGRLSNATESTTLVETWATKWLFAGGVNVTYAYSSGRISMYVSNHSNIFSQRAKSELGLSADSCHASGTRTNSTGTLPIIL